MPVYEYKCSACGQEFEYQQRMSDPAKDLCEACGGKLERLISRTAFQLKGAGWYKDLYSSAKPGEAIKAPDKHTPTGKVTVEGGGTGSSGGSTSSDAGSSSSGGSSGGGSGGGESKGGGGGGSTSTAAAAAVK